MNAANTEDSLPRVGDAPRPEPGAPGSAAPDGRTRYANGERRRAEIVERASRIFAEQGYQHLSLRQLADAIGVSHALLRHHFGTKDAILQAVLTRREDAERDWRADLFARFGLLDALPRVMAHNATIRGLIHLDAVLRAEAINPDHPAHDYVVALGRRFRRQLLADLEAERAAGRLRDDLDLEITAIRIMSLIEGVQMEWLLDPSVDMAAVVSAFADQLRA
ncbi:TetR/AcrR family transcriptional regulator [Actinomyces culturomici]|uniref:TetR/AcrR family transcriptional regulator n=1 Tax=Actinomyces culturomici TaxID=1926276 RepID=UPI000E207B81|nr:TetR/AcrR family transcriptional regulator [Actinomyces culturomici]